MLATPVILANGPSATLPGMVFSRLPAVSLTLVALIAGGCGAASKDSAKNFSGEAKQVATTIEDLQAAASKRDATKICSQYLATALVDKIKAHGKSTCETTLKESLKDVDSFELEVVKKGVTVTGTTATAKVKSASGKDDRVDTLQLVKEPQRTGGKTVEIWKISALAS
ncbi:MAG: nuclear transport factor 2 family protein [Solirubrobacterales bacterium]|nr:nuclear transport factor 2 family protein [Solirubrobacterales bacterium]